MAGAVISGRVDEKIRQKAEVVMRKAGLTPTDIIQSVWALIAEKGEIPEIARPSVPPTKEQEAMARLKCFLESMPPANPRYAGWSDDDIMALKVRDYE